LAGPAADVIDVDDDETKLAGGSETNDVSMTTAAGALLITANNQRSL